MSNSKVRKELEEKESNTKLLEAYKKKADFILNHQMCKAYFKDSALSVISIVEKILKTKYNLPWQDKLIRKALADVKGKTNALVSIPQFKYEKNVHDILAEFVIKNFSKMVMDKKYNRMYPLAFNDIVDRYS